MDYVEDYARRWANKEEVGVDALSEWVKSIAPLVNRCIVLYKTIFVLNIIIHMCLQHSNTL